MSNNPKGSKTKVDPIKSLKDISTIKKLLVDKKREMCLFTLGINTNLRAIDLLNLKVGMVRDLNPGDELVLYEQKTGKNRRINLNAGVIKSINDYIKSHHKNSEEDAFLFVGQRGKMTTAYVNRLVKSWCGKLNLKGNYGSHTLRKTWGYHQRVSFKVGLPELMTCFNHSSQAQTLAYLCVQSAEIKAIYENQL